TTARAITFGKRGRLGREELKFYPRRPRLKSARPGQARNFATHTQGLFRVPRLRRSKPHPTLCPLRPKRDGPASKCELSLRADQAPAEWSRWNVSLRLAVAPAWPAELVGVAQPATRRMQARTPLVLVAYIRSRRGA